MPTARECHEDVMQLMKENRAEEAQLGSWQWVKRRQLHSEWMRMAEYNIAVMRIMEEEEQDAAGR